MTNFKAMLTGAHSVAQYEISQVNSSSYGFLKCGSVPNYCQSRQPEADNFGAGLGTFLQFYVYDLRFNATGLTTLLMRVLNTECGHGDHFINTIFHWNSDHSNSVETLFSCNIVLGN